MPIIEGSIPRGAGVERGPGAVHYVDTVNGLTGASGASWGEAYALMSTAVAACASGDTIFFRGRVAEHVTTPVNVFDVSIIGVSNRPRHADAAPAGGNLSAQWQAPADAATPLLKIIQQGWRLENFLMDPTSGSSCVQLFRDGGAADAERDASHASFKGMRFVGGSMGIQGSGGPGHVLIDDCEFHDLTTGLASTTGAGIGQPGFRWTVRNCRFRANTNHIVIPAEQMHIHDNIFGSFVTKGIDLSGGTGKNVVTRNLLSGTYSHVGGYTEGTTDEWGGNFNSLSGGVTAALPA